MIPHHGRYHAQPPPTQAKRATLAADLAQRVSVSRRRGDLGDRRAGGRIPAASVSLPRNHCGGVLAADGERHPGAPCARHRDPARRRLRAGGHRGRRPRHPDGPLAPRRGHRAAAGQHRRADPRPRLCAAVPVVVRAGQHLGGAAGRVLVGLPDGGPRPAPVPPRHPAGRPALHPHRPASRLGPGLAHSGRRRDARRRAVGARLDDLRRARIPQHGRDAGRRGGDRGHRPCAREVGVPAARTVHRGALGDDDMSESARSYLRAAVTIACAAALYEALARSGWFAPALMPTLPQVGSALATSLADGTMLRHTVSTLYRVLFGLSLAIVVGLPIGILMGRFRAVENFVLPLASALMPIPSLAWVPVFILWFGLGDTVTILLVL